MATIISTEVEDKLRDKHQVTPKEVDECLLNMTGRLLKDDRAQHKTNPTTWWFIAETNHKRLLKVCFMLIDGDIHIKSAFEPNLEELRIYKKYG
ncbi:hypothetical protein [Leclercia adecarboxylata]|uniref:hypothetical protein n=1 Tax=Leclercia adecarboxylata TaxID=83655 RepID=UPI001CBF9DE6|nr:hypothetical protein [Leclercia adecarboxylata]MBZ3803356.1 hypothetical protein [Leclercia adecarboxylata]MBZ3808051.1 hypothetical protein [Leclercia adecarboxylata]